MSNMNPSEDWGRNHLSQFIDLGRRHTFETVQMFRPEFNRLVDIDSLFKRIQDNLYFTKEWFVDFFLMRTHSSFLCASNVAMCGQLPEAYMVLRGSLENALYGLYLSRHKEDVETWLRRGESLEMKNQVRNKFTNSMLLSFLQAVDPRLGELAHSLYEQTIDLGAHPNELALTSALRVEQTDTKRTFKLAYISGDSDANQLCLLTAAHIGLFGLSVFRHVFKERYDLLGISIELDKLKTTL